MNWRKHVRNQLVAQSGDADETIVEELAQHAQSSVEAARADGSSAADAESRVRAEVDRWCADAALRSPRSKRPAAIAAPAASSSALAGLALDVRFGFRVLRRRPGFVAVAVLTMALGVAGVATLCAVGYGVLLRPPWADADRLVLVTESRRTRSASSRASPTRPISRGRSTRRRSKASRVTARQRSRSVETASPQSACGPIPRRRACSQLAHACDP